MNSATSESAVTEAKKSRSYVWGLALILGSLSAFGPLSIDMYLPALPSLAVDLHSSTSMTQFSLTACLLGMAIGQIFAGPISDIRGRRGPLLVGLLVYAISSLLCAFALSMEIFVVMRFIQGLAGSVGIVISRAAVRDLYAGTELTRFFSFLMLINGAAPILAPIFGAQILQFTAWRGVFFVLAAIGLVMLLAVFWGLNETLPAARRSRAGLGNTVNTFRGLLKNKKFMGYTLSQGFSLAAMFAYISGAPFVLQNIYGVSPQLFSVFFAVNGLGIILAGQITGWLAGRVTEKNLLVIGLMLGFGGGAALLAAILSGGSLLTISLALFFVVSSVGIIGTSSFALAMQDQANAAGSASALIGLLSFVLGGIMAPLVGMAGSFSALPMGIVIIAAESAAILSYWLLAKN